MTDDAKSAPQQALDPKLLEVAEMLEGAWDTAAELRAGRQMWDELVHSLGAYGNATNMLAMWHRDSVLSGCRRLADRGEDTSSVRRALVIMSEHPDHVDVDAVQADLARLDELVKPIKAMVVDVIAHQLLSPKGGDSITFDEVDTFIAETQDIIGRWLHELRGVPPLGARRAVFGVRDMTTALRLHNQRAYAAARRRAVQSRGPGATNEQRRAAVDSITTRYELGGP